MDTIFNNVYIPVIGMEKLQKDFYMKLYNYKKYCRGCLKKSGSDEFKINDTTQKAITALNASYEKIKDLSRTIKNRYGEYPYPQVSYKTRNNVVYVCIDGSDMRQKIDIGNVFGILAAYKDATMLIKQNSKDDKDTSIFAETTIKQIANTFKNNYDSFVEKKYDTHLHNLLCCIDKYPAGSISELALGNIFSKSDIESCLKEF